MKNTMFYYSVGALLYCPANNYKIVNSIVNEKFGKNFSLALCLEDTISDNCVAEAESILVTSLKSIHKERAVREFFLPKIFIRVRNAPQMIDLVKRLGKVSEIVTGFIFPKFCLENADEYISAVLNINLERRTPFYFMPIFEHSSIIHLQNRYEILYRLKAKLDRVENLVLNIRVGGNDLCHIFGFRRSATQSIHDIRPISSIFSDIITVYGADYVISAPVWEYYNGNNWDSGMEQEIMQDKLCGFVGKTVIHPKQIAVVNNAYKVTQKDLDDALSILKWNKHTNALVSGSVTKERMNEFKTHSNWALKTVMLSRVCGVV